MRLRKAQSKFALCAAKLAIYAYEQGYELTCGDAFRDPRKFGKYGERPENCYSHSKSNHKLKLAKDYNLFRDGRFLSKTSDHKPLGDFWEALGEQEGLPLRWGGRWNDGNHYELNPKGFVDGF